MLNESEIINQLKSIAVAGGMPLLRIYWYDGSRSGMTVEQTTLANMPDVKVRLGYVNSAGEQKGVDSLIVTDLIDLARNQAIADAYVVTGDGDMRIAVQIAQNFGVRVHLINLEPAGVSLNPQLRQEVDTVHEISRSEVAKFMQVKETRPIVLSIAASDGSAITIDDAAKQAIKTVLASLDSPNLQKIKSAVSPVSGIPQEFDRKILGTCRALMGRELDVEERRQMRKIVESWLKQA